MTIGTIKQAKWQGEAINARVVVAIVGDEPAELKEQIERQRPEMKRYLWFTPFIGTSRQVIECKTAHETWYLDNMDGTGLRKVLNGGWPNDSHASIYPAEIMHEVPATHWNHYSDELARINKEEIDEGWMAIDAEGYTEHKKQMESLIASMRRYQEMDTNGKIKHIRENMMVANPSKQHHSKRKRDGRGKR